MGEMKRIAQALADGDYPPPPDRWSHPTAADERERAQVEVKTAEARAALRSGQARRAADMSDGQQAAMWAQQARQAHEQAAFWREVVRNMTGQPEEDDEGPYLEQYERSQSGGA